MKKVTLQQCESNQKKLLINMKDEMIPMIRKISDERKLNGITMENEYKEEIMKFELEIFTLRYQGYEKLKNNLHNAENIIKEAKLEVEKVEKQRDDFKEMYKNLMEKASIQEIIEAVERYTTNTGIKPTVIYMSSAYANEVTGKDVGVVVKESMPLAGMKVIIDDSLKSGFSIANEYKQEKLK